MAAKWREEVYALLHEGIASYTFPAAAVAIGVANETQLQHALGFHTYVPHELVVQLRPIIFT
jgi:hypothetical protein